MFHAHREPSGKPIKLERWVELAEITASIGGMVTLVILIIDVRENTRAIDRQVQPERMSLLGEPFVSSPDIPRIYAAIKAVDGQ